MYDEDESGGLDKEEAWIFFQDALKYIFSQEENITDEEFEVYFIEVDTDGDGIIAKDEMANFFFEIL